MKITFLAPHIKIAGGIRAILTYADLLAKRNHEVTVIVPIANFFKRLAGNFFKNKPRWFKNFAAQIRWAPDYSEKFIPNGDVVVATAWQTAGPVASYGPARGRKFYLIQHYESLYHGVPEKADKSYRLPLHKIVISSWLKNIMKEKFSAESDLIVTPVDFKTFHYVEGIRRENPVRILLLDHNAKWKGTTEGAGAFGLVRKEFPGIKLVLFGVRRKVTGIPHDEYFYNPKQEDLAKIYSSCHVYLCPSEYEGLGMPSMGAMASRCALVTYDNGGSQDYAFDGKTAFVARHGNFDDLVNKLKMAVGNTALREEIANNGHEFIKANFSWEKAVEKMEDIFSVNA